MSSDIPTESNRIVFLLMEGFSLFSLAAALETLRLANAAGGGELYEWLMVSEDGRPATSSSGMTINVNYDLVHLYHRDTIVVCGGPRIQHSLSKRTLNWLRRESLKGTTIAAVDTGAYAMAKAGLLNGRRATIDRQHRDSFSEDFPKVEHCSSNYIVDGNRMTSVGGIASTELILHLIAEERGEPLANRVAQNISLNSIRPSEPQQASELQFGTQHPKIASVIHTMEDNIEEPISALTIARTHGMSLRQMERLFRRYLNSSPKRFYMEIRLQRARNLLLQTEMTLLDIAMACGFGSPSHFSKCYRLRYNMTPYRDRGLHSGVNPGGEMR